METTTVKKTSKEKVQSIREKQDLLLNELYRSFEFFNKHFYESKLKTPLITLQGDKGRKTYGWFGKNFWCEKNSEDSNIDELNLTAETLHREPSLVLETLLHEMAHLKNAQHGVEDCTETQYHNKAFKVAAEEVGLVVERMKGKGWALTSLGEIAKTAIQLLKPDVSKYCIVRKPPMKLKKPPTTIPLSVDLEYEEKVLFLEAKFKNKREMTEKAIDMLFDKLKIKK